MNKKLQEMWIALKETASHDWKYHKASSIAFWYGFAILIGFTILAVQCVKLKVAMPDYLLTGGVILMAALLLYQFFCKVSNSIREEEQEKEEKSLQFPPNEKEVER